MNKCVWQPWTVGTGVWLRWEGGQSGGQGNAGCAIDVRALQSSLSRLKSQFPGSLRVQRLSGMMLEAQGK